MSGICGVVGRASEAELGVMTDAMSHRGPDGRGIEMFPGEPPAALGHRRLAILDPTPAGAQPMSLGNRWWITFNGELYNFRELRTELETRGERFVSECDTEVLLRLFVLEGPAMLTRLNGIFAFAVWDDRDKRLFLARDRLGVKPLYYTTQTDLFAFSSELRSLLPLIGRATFDESALADYMTFLWVPDPKTAFREIRKLPPGHYAWAGPEGIEPRQFWDLRFEPEERSEEEWRDLVADAVTRCVRRQMVSDVPLGAFLSGGIDSSAIVAAMSGENERVTTCTVVDREDLGREIVPEDIKHAREIGSLFKTKYHEHIVEPDVLELLPKAVWHLEEPVADPGAISTFLTCRAAATQMSVILSGIGGDEVFAGHPRYLAYRISRSFDMIPRPLALVMRQLMSMVGTPGHPGRLRGPRRNLWKFMRGAGLPPLERYLAFVSYYTTSERHRLLSPAFVAELGDYDPLEQHRGYLDAVSGRDELSRLLYLEAKTRLPCLNLILNDKMSMAASLEVRVPLLDDELVDLAAHIPSNLKLRRLRRKYIFKRSQERVLPREVVWRRKRGFGAGAPIRSWLTDLAPLTSELLSESTVAERGIFDPKGVTSLREEDASGRADNSLQLYALLNLELWFRTFTDRTWTFDALADASAAMLA